MKGLWGLLVLSFTLSLYLVPDLTMANENDIFSANGHFASDMFKSLSSRSTGNILFSPLSAHTVLSMVYQGSGGTTKKALEDSLYVSSPDDTATSYSSIIYTRDKDTSENITLIMANKIYVGEDYKLNSQVQDTVAKKFYSEIESLSFGDKAKALEVINSWVSEKTMKKIPELLEESDVTDSVVMVLLNAIYFKAKWATPFDKEDTQSEKFFVSSDKEVDVDMMHNTDIFAYHENSDLDAKTLELPYENSDFSMFIILPNQRGGIADLESKLFTYDLSEIVGKGHLRQVDVALPKFKLETNLNLKETLTDIGLGELFDPDKCNLGGLVESVEKLFVGKAVQKAFIDVDEIGTEAAAATAVVVLPGALPPPRDLKKFTADHPFVFAIMKKNPQAQTLFIGEYKDPKF